MRKILLAIIIALVPLSAYAADATLPKTDVPAATLPKTDVPAAGTLPKTTAPGTFPPSTASTNAIIIPPHKIGDCVKINNGLWQQLSDGTWAEPSDPINTCKSAGSNSAFSFGMLPNGIANAGSFNGLSGLPALLALNNNSNNLGNLSTSQWLTNCVLAIVARPECQGLNGLLSNTGLYNNIGNSGILGSVANGLLYSQLGVNSNSNTFFAKTGDYGVAVNVPTKNEGLTKALSIFSMGWSLSHLF